MHGAVAVVTLHNPPVNGSSLELREFIVASIAHAEGDTSVRAIIRHLHPRLSEATIRGFEFEGTLAPTATLEGVFGIGYTDFEYDRFTDALNRGQAALAPGALGRVDLDDQQAYTPEWSANAGLSYRVGTPVGAFVPRVDGAYRSKTYFDAPNTEQIAQPGYEVYNASLRFESVNERFTATAGVTNFTNEAYKVSVNSSLTAASGYAEVVYAPPRQWFVEMSFTF